MRGLRQARAGRGARPDGRPDICVNCCQLPEATCSRCQRLRPCTFAATGQPVCPSCAPGATAACARCGQDRPPQARRPEGPVRDPCYTAALRHRGPCAACGQVRRLVAPPGPAADTCADCAKIPVTCACGDCGIEDKLYEKGRCARCSLRRRAAQLLPAGTGIVAPELTGVLSAVTAARQPRSALNWLRKGAGASLLADVAAGRLAVSHQALDTHPRRRAADYLRHMLTAGGAPPPRDEELARAERWLAILLDTIEPAADRRLVQAYATWQVIRRLRASARGRGPPPRTPATTSTPPRGCSPGSAAAASRSPASDRPTSTNGCTPGRPRPWPGTSWPGPPHAATASALPSPSQRAPSALPSAKTSGGPW